MEETSTNHSTDNTENSPVVPPVPQRSLSDADQIIAPELGLIFKDRYEAFSFFKLYALRTGFSPVRRSLYRLTGQPYKATFACSRGRKAISEEEDDPHHSLTLIPPPGFEDRKHGEHRTNCRAMMLIRDDMLNGLWEVKKVITEHNHDLNPRSVRFFKSHRNLPEFVKIQLKINDAAGMPQNQSIKSVFAQNGGIENCSFNERDCYNHVQANRALRIKDGDANSLMRYFQLRQATSPSFFYQCLYNEGRVSCIFWIHGRARAAYRYFGDVITFDTTYLTNKYEMPFAPFVGVNHHGQSTLLGCALLPNETTETYIWVLRTWLQAMDGVRPDGIITDQCQAIGNAVKTVFPTTRHRLCLWHIAKKFPQKCGTGPVGREILARVRQLVYSSQTVAEFEIGWTGIINSIPSSNTKRDWFQFMYGIREKWVPIYTHEHFWAGMQTTQRSESINSFFDGFVNSTTNLTTFVERYEDALRSRWHKETQEDFNDFKSRPKLISAHFYEKQFAMAYTRFVFYVFQKQIQQLLNLHSQLLSNDGIDSVFLITGNNQQDREVSVNNETMIFSCPCNLFAYRAIVCCHALCAFRHMGVDNLPSALFVDRWRKDLLRTHTTTGIPAPITFRNLDSYDSLYTNAHAILLNLIETASPHINLHAHILRRLESLLAECQIIRDENVAAPNPEPIQQVLHIEEVLPPVYEPVPPILDPLTVPRVGRPRNKRIRSSGECSSRPTKRTKAPKRQSSNPISPDNDNEVPHAFRSFPIRDELASISHTGLLMRMHNMSHLRDDCLVNPRVGPLSPIE